MCNVVGIRKEKNMDNKLMISIAITMKKVTF